MAKKMLRSRCLSIATVSLILASSFATGETLQLAESKLSCDAPATWRVVKPANRLLEHELAVDPPKDIKASPARMTIMQAGGTIEANTSRWIGQFKDTEAGADRSAAKVEKQEINGMTVTTVEIAGTYMESLRGPFGPKTPREEYRLVGAIVETGVAGNYFFKLVGPDTTVSPARDAFIEMLKSLKKKSD